MTTTTGQADFVDELRAIVGVDGVLDHHSELAVYECDAFVLEKRQPLWLRFRGRRRTSRGS